LADEQFGCLARFPKKKPCRYSTHASFRVESFVRLPNGVYEGIIKKRGKRRGEKERGSEKEREREGERRERAERGTTKNPPNTGQKLTSALQRMMTSGSQGLLYLGILVLLWRKDYQIFQFPEPQYPSRHLVHSPSHKQTTKQQSP
jgi:hypothetical protein